MSKRTGKDLIWDGVKYKSGFEVDTAKSIPIPFEYEPLALPYTIFSDYTPDFKFVTKAGNTVYVEAKGKLDYAARVKMEAVKRSHPDKDIRMLFIKNNKVYPRSQFRYSDWAEKHGFPWAVGTIPPEWYDA